MSSSPIQDLVGHANAKTDYFDLSDGFRVMLPKMASAKNRHGIGERQILMSHDRRSGYVKYPDGSYRRLHPKPGRAHKGTARTKRRSEAAYVRSLYYLAPEEGAPEAR